MELIRGSIVLAAGGGYASKPRPFVVVQSNAFVASHASVTLCPVTSTVGGGAMFRVALPPTFETGLRSPSEVQVDKILTVRRDRVGRVIGHAPPASLELVDQALRRWLAL